MIGLMMMKMNNVVTIENYLDTLYPNPKCELNYEKDYELLIAVVLSAQTTDKRVNMVTPVLFQKYDTLEKLRDAPPDEIADILRSIGSFRKKALYVQDIAYRLLQDFNGKVPNDQEALQTMKGVGRKTANVVLSNLYEVPAIAVDTHVERVSKRLGLVKPEATVLEVEQTLQKKYKKEVWSKRHHQMVLFGRYHCKAIKPECETCSLKEICKEKRQL